MRRHGWWLLLLGLCACGEATGSSLRLRVHFASPDTAARADHVEVSIVVGSCSSDDIVYTSTVTREIEAATPSNLANGPYSLRGRAIDDHCTLVAAGCAALTLPSPGASVELVLDDVPAERVCTGTCAEQCSGIRADGGGGGGSSGGGGGSDGGNSGGGAGSPDAGTTLDDAGMPKPDAGAACDALKGPNGHCYRLESKVQTFADAEAACVTWGGHLVSFNDADEELWVSQQAAALAVGGVPLRFWIGFTDGVTEAEWVWTDESTAPSSVISFTDAMGKVKYRTASDTPYVHWGPNSQTVGNSEPNNKPPKDVTSPEGQDCATSNGAKVSGPDGLTPRPEWDDRVCSELNVSVCERP